MIYAIYDVSTDLYLFFGYFSSEEEAKRQFMEFCRDFGSTDLFLCRCGSFRHATGELIPEPSTKILRGFPGNLFPEIAKTIEAERAKTQTKFSSLFSKIAKRFCRKKTRE